MNMMLMEFFIIAGVIFYTIRCALKERDPKVFIIKFSLCSTAAWISEESSILLYGFYTYNPAWKIFIVDVPLIVVIVWPALIHSATILSSQMLSTASSMKPIIAGCIVLTDAMLIEPISVNFNLWLWHQPGLFGVPLIGILGWAYFSFFSAIFFAPVDLQSGKIIKWPLLIVVPAIGTHLLLLISYWAFLRWTIRPISPAYATGFVWIVSVILSISFLVTKIGYRTELKTLILRLPAAIFFYTLLFMNQDSSMSLVVYSLAFIPPYLVLSLKSYLNLGTK